MADEMSIRLLAQWRNGSQQAAEELFRRYVDRLMALARGRLSEQLARRIDPEDVVQSAYRSFFVGAREGRFAVERGGDLWRLLVAITLHKLKDQVDRHTADKRSVAAEQALGNQQGLPGIQPQLLSREPSPLEALSLWDEVEQMLRQLDPMARQLLEMRLQGYNLEEIAAALRCSERTVIRVLKRIKQQLEERRIASPATGHRP
jgi:RNA polymerase sigma factor (sigma-70 family)